MNIIFVEAGHGKSPLGFTDNGAVGKYRGSKITERDYSKAIARKVLDILHDKTELSNYIVQGVGVETDASIQKKMKYVNTIMTENRAVPSQCFGVAIHMNSQVPEARGWEIWYQKNGKSLAFANSVAKSLDEYKVIPPRQIPILPSSKGRFRRFYIDDTLANYLIIECGFITNIDDATIIWDNLDRVAESIAHGILEHIRNL